MFLLLRTLPSLPPAPSGREAGDANAASPDPWAVRGEQFFCSEHGSFSTLSVVYTLQPHSLFVPQWIPKRGNHNLAVTASTIGSHSGAKARMVPHGSPNQRVNASPQRGREQPSWKDT